MAKKIRAAILDDHPITINGYLYWLEKDPQIEVAAIMTYGDELEPTLKKTPADVLLLDINAPTSSENKNPYPILHIIPKLLQEHPDLHILVSSMHTERGVIRAVMNAGASGYLFKDDPVIFKNLGNVVKIVAEGGVHFSQAAYDSYAKSLSNETDKLTPRELEALSLCAAYPDAKSSEVGAKLKINRSTARNLLSNAYVKLGVHTRAAAIAKARQMGLITPYQPETPKA